MKQPNLILLRHGESVWNKKHIFTGWIDINLSRDGEKEARKAGRLLKKKGFAFDRAYTSVLKRSINTLKLCLEGMGVRTMAAESSWRLNERHYGDLQGKSKLKIAKQFGADQLLLWRRSFKVRPPALKGARPKGHCSPETCGLKPSQMPKTESLEDTYKRVLPYWKQEILPALKKGENVLVVAHGNSLRALIKYLDKVSDKKIIEIEVPTGKPLGYEISKTGKALKKAYIE